MQRLVKTSNTGWKSSKMFPWTPSIHQSVYQYAGSIYSALYGTVFYPGHQQAQIFRGSSAVMWAWWSELNELIWIRANCRWAWQVDRSKQHVTEIEQQLTHCSQVWVKLTVDDTRCRPPLRRIYAIFSRISAQHLVLSRPRALPTTYLQLKLTIS